MCSRAKISASPVIRPASFISLAVRPLGLTYSRFMEGLKAANIDLDRKSLSELAIANPEAFKAVFEQAKKAIEAKEGATLKA